MMRRIAALVLTVIGACSLPCNAQNAVENGHDAMGSLCVLPNPAARPTRISPGGDYNPDTLKLQVDKRPPINWPHTERMRIDDLDLGERHLVVLTSDSKRIFSFWFKFSEYLDSNLCIYFDGYQGVDLGNTRDALWCKVKKRDCWR
jgi:hypothetical protein